MQAKVHRKDGCLLWASNLFKLSMKSLPMLLQATFCSQKIRIPLHEQRCINTRSRKMTMLLIWLITFVTLLLSVGLKPNSKVGPMLNHQKRVKQVPGKLFFTSHHEFALNVLAWFVSDGLAILKNFNFCGSSTLCPLSLWCSLPVILEVVELSLLGSWKVA